MRCIISLVFLVKLGKIVIVKEEKLSMKMGSFLIKNGGICPKLPSHDPPKFYFKIFFTEKNLYNNPITILEIYLRCIISLVFLVKLGKIVIVKEGNSPLKRRVFDLKIAYSKLLR